MSQVQERHEDYMKRRLHEEGIGVNTEYTNMRLTKEIEELKHRSRTRDTGKAYTG